jgi:hypothetical protein
VTFSLGLFSHYTFAASVLVVLLVIGLAVAGYFASQRLKQSKTRLAAILLTNTVAALTVLGLAFDIQLTNNQASVTYLVTQGATTEQLEQIDAQQSVFVLQGAVISINNKNILDAATQIENPSQLLSYQPRFENLHVVGDGLSLSQWQDMQLLMGKAFNNISVRFSASTPRLGLVNMSWPRELAIGQFIEVKGQLQGIDELAVDHIYELNLLDPVGQLVETIRLKASERFSLSFPAKSMGQWVYRLQLSKPGDMQPLLDEPLAFSVTKPTPVRILIKQSAASFETRQLKNWAAQLGSQISVLTQISQTKDIRQNINLSAAELTQITSPFTEQALINFDWLLIDGRALLTLTAQHMTALKAAIKNGLGVYIIADNALINAWPVPLLDWLSDIKIQPLDVASFSAIPKWPHSKIEGVMPLAKAIITSANNSSLVQSNDAKILVSRSKVGLGHVAVSLINGTYGWQTSGLTEQYSHYWQSVIFGLARPRQAPYWLNAASDTLAWVNQHQQKCVLGATASGVATYDQHPLSLILTHDILQVEQRCLTIWPTNAGWHKLAWSQDSALSATPHKQDTSIETWFYAHAKQDWQEWRQLQNRLISQKIAQQQNTQRFEKTSVKSLDKIWFWGILVLSMSILWLERKLF